MTLTSVTRKISNLRYIAKVLFIIDGIFKLLLITSLFIIFSFFLDYMLRFPTTVRLFFLIIGLGLHIWAIHKFLWVPISTYIEDDSIALAIEKNYPELNDRLISAIQFSRLLKNPEYPDSISMTQAVVDDAVEFSKDINFQSIIKPLKILTSAIIPISLLIIIGTYFSIYPNLWSLWLKRGILLNEVPWPQKTQLFLVKGEFFVVKGGDAKIIASLDNGIEDATLCYQYVSNKGIHWEKINLEKNSNDGEFTATIRSIKKPIYIYIKTDRGESSLYKLLTIEKEKDKNISDSTTTIKLNFPDYEIVRAKGNDLMLSFVAIGEVPSTVWLYTQKKDEGWKHAPTIFQGERVFRYTFQALTEEFSFFVSGGDDDDELPIYNIKVLTPPSVETILAWYTYPPYTHLPPTPDDSPQNHGNLNAIIGSKAKISIRTNIDIKSGDIAFAEKHKDIMPLVPMEFPSSGDHKTLQCEIPIKISTRYTINLVAQNGLADPNPSSFYLRALQDRKPVVRIISPGKSLDMTPEGTLPMSFHTTDDFGVGKITLCYKVNQEKDWRFSPITEKENKGIAYGAKEIFSEILWKMKDIKILEGQEQQPLKPGDLITYFVQASDENTETGPGIGETDHFTINLTTKGDLERILNEKLMEIKKEISALKKSQEENRDALAKFLGVEGKIEASDMARILNIQMEQRQISRNADRIGNDIKEILDALENNQLWDSHTKQRITQVQDLVWGVAREKESGKYDGKSQGVVQNLVDAYHENKDNIKTIFSFMESGKAIQEEIIKDFESAIELLERWEDYNEIIQSFRDLIEQQNQTNTSTKEAYQQNR